MEEGGREGGRKGAENSGQKRTMQKRIMEKNEKIKSLNHQEKLLRFASQLKHC